MQNLQFKPFSKDELVIGLREKFLQYKFQTGLGALRVRTSGFTITGNVAIKNNPKTGNITTSTKRLFALSSKKEKCRSVFLSSYQVRV